VSHGITNPDDRAFPLDGDDGFNAGLTKREWLIGQILSGSGMPVYKEVGLSNIEEAAKSIGWIATKIADAAISEMNK